jgi:glucose-1-phosphate adenylyltransferase
LIQGAEIHQSVIGIRSVIGEDVVLRDTVIMGADYYESPGAAAAAGLLPIGIGEGSHLRGAIVDKNARLGKAVRIEPFPRGVNLDQENWSVRDGVVVVPKGAIIDAGAHIGPQG